MELHFNELKMFCQVKLYVYAKVKAKIFLGIYVITSLGISLFEAWQIEEVIMLFCKQENSAF